MHLVIAALPEQTFGHACHEMRIPPAQRSLVASAPVAADLHWLSRSSFMPDQIWNATSGFFGVTISDE